MGGLSRLWPDDECREYSRRLYLRSFSAPVVVEEPQPGLAPLMSPVVRAVGEQVRIAREELLQGRDSAVA
jgi:hypothetical protein